MTIPKKKRSKMKGPATFERLTERRTPRDGFAPRSSAVDLPDDVFLGLLSGEIAPGRASVYVSDAMSPVGPFIGGAA